MHILFLMFMYMYFVFLNRGEIDGIRKEISSKEALFKKKTKVPNTCACILLWIKFHTHFQRHAHQKATRKLAQAQKRVSKLESKVRKLIFMQSNFIHGYFLLIGRLNHGRK